MVLLDGNFAPWLPLNTFISMYARTNRCHNERSSRTNYVRSSVPDCIYKYIYIYIYIYIVIKYIYIYDELKSYPRLRKPVGSFPWLRVGTGLAVS